MVEQEVQVGIQSNIYGTDFSALITQLNQNFHPKKPITMSRQNRSIARDKKSEEPRRDVAGNNERYSRQDREGPRNERERDKTDHISGLDRYRLNDLYERSSL